MRSNMARTWVSGRVPAACAAMKLRLPPALERGHVTDELVELLRLLLLEPLEVRHEGGRVHQRPGDRLAPEPVTDVGQVRPERVAVLSDLVAAEAAGGGHYLLPPLELGVRLQRDLAVRAGEGA